MGSLRGSTLAAQSQLASCGVLFCLEEPNLLGGMTELLNVLRNVHDVCWVRSWGRCGASLKLMER